MAGETLPQFEQASMEAPTPEVLSVSPETKPIHPFNVLIVGSGPFASDTMTALMHDGQNIVGIAIPKTKEGEKPDRFRTFASEMGYPDDKTFNLGELRKPEFADTIKGLGVDLIVGANLTAKIRPHIPEAAPAGMIAFHPSLLGDNAGMSAIPSRIIQMNDADEAAGKSDEEIDNTPDTFGLSCYRIENDSNSKKLDSGRIIQQYVIEMDSNEYTSAGAYSQVLAELGVKLLSESVQKVAKEYAEGRIYWGEAQEGEGSYEDPITKSDVKIDWNELYFRVHNKVRAGKNNPLASTTVRTPKGEFNINIHEAKRVRDGSQEPALIKRIDDEGIQASTRRNSILITKAQIFDVVDGSEVRQDIVSGAQLAEAIGLEEGMSFDLLDKAS